jgi:hypothetical protein
MRFDGRQRIGYGLSMSRYKFVPEHWPTDKSYVIAVGWYPLKRYYFLQVMDYTIHRDGTCFLMNLGTLPPYYTDIDQLMQAFNKTVYELSRQFTPVVLPDTVRRKLIRDQERSRRRSQPV